MEDLRTSIGEGMKSLKRVLLTTLVLLWVNGYSGWMKTYGGSNRDEGRSVQQTKDGGYIMTGVFGMDENLEGGDVYLIKTDPSGNELWIKTYGGSKGDEGCSVQQTTDGGYIVVGNTYSFGAGEADLWLLKTDKNGDTLWTKTYGGGDDDYGSEVQLTKDGGYIIIGTTSSFGVGGKDIWLLKTDAKGDTLWTKTYGGENDDEGNSVKELKSGGYIVAGVTRSFRLSPFGSPTADIWLIRTDADGDTLWTKLIGENDWGEWGSSIEKLKEEGFIIVGTTQPTDLPWIGGYIYTVKTDSLGNSVWVKKSGEIGSGGAVRQTKDRGFIITGTKGYIMSDVWLIKTDREGDILWTKTYGGERDDYGGSVQQTTDGGYIVVGTTESFGMGRGDVWLIKTDSLGNVGIEEKPSSSLNPLSLRLSLLHPFKVSYTLPSTSEVRLELFNAAGRRLKSFALGKKGKGEHHEYLPIDKLPSGIYFIRLKTDKGVVTQKSILLK